MYKYILLVICLSSFISTAQVNSEINLNGMNVFYHENGVIASEGVLSEGIPDGYWKSYHDNGKRKSEGNRVNTLLDGVWKFYNEEGIVISELDYKNGKKDGVCRVFDAEKGSLIESTKFNNNIKNGESKFYYPAHPVTGKQVIKKIVPFKNGLESGKGYTFLPQGQATGMTIYKNGFIKKEIPINQIDVNGWKQNRWKSFYSNGKVKEELTYINDTIDGKVKKYSESGKILEVIKYVKGKDEREVKKLEQQKVVVVPEIKKTYHPNGVVEKVGLFKEGIAIGVHREYTPDGGILTAKVYSNGSLVGEGLVDGEGKKQGSWKQFSAKGLLKGQGMFLNDKHVGEWVYYYESGCLEQKGAYDQKGRAQKTWRWYYPCDITERVKRGRIKRIEHYHNNSLEGEMVEYNDSNEVVTKGEYLDNKKEGFWILEYLNYKEEGSFVSGKRDGVWKHYYRNKGNLRFEGGFLNNEPDGIQLFYYQNGKRRQEGNFTGGLKDGKWKYYDDEGMLFLIIQYENGREVSLDGIEITTQQ